MLRERMMIIVPWILGMRVDCVIPSNVMVVVVLEVCWILTMSYCTIVQLIGLIIIPGVRQSFNGLITNMIFDWHVVLERIRLMINIALICWIRVIVTLWEARLTIQFIRILVCVSIDCIWLKSVSNWALQWSTAESGSLSGMNATDKIRFTVGLSFAIVTNVTLLILVSSIAIVFTASFVILTIWVATL